MPTLGNSVFNWGDLFQEWELIRCKSVIEENFKINKIPDENKLAFSTGCIGDKSVHKLRKFD